MKFLNTRLKRTGFWIFIVVVTFVIVVIAFISPIAKWAIEKYDTKFIGREVTLDLAYVNPFTGSAYLKNVKVYEENSDSVFLSSSISVNFEMMKLLSKTYEISELTLTEPKIRIIQDKKEFNFDDVIHKFSPKDTLKAKEPPTRFNLLNVKISNGTFYYIEKSIPINYFIKNVDIETNGKRWDTDTMGFHFSFVSGIGVGGTMKGNFDINTSSLDYHLATVVSKYDISILEQYVKDVANYGKVRGNLDAILDAKGNFKNSENLVAKGPLAVNDFHFGKKNEDYLSFKRLAVDIIQLSPKNKKYLFDSISLLQPYFKYQRYDTLDNLQDMFGKNGEKAKQSKAQTDKVNILFKIGGYVEDLAKNFFKSEFKLVRLAVYSADLHYDDFSLNEEFAAAVSPLTLIADSIERSDKWVNLTLRTNIQPYGHLAFDLSINPKDSSDFNLNYRLSHVSLAMLNPYFVTFTSFPMDRGIVELKGQASVNNGIIQSTNHFIVIDPRINNKQKRNGNKWLPMRLFMFLARDAGNVIDYEIPIKGSLKDPKFKFWGAIKQVLANIVVKPVTTPYRAEVKNAEDEIEKSINLKWVMRSAGLNSPEEKFIAKMVEFLKKNPEEYITVTPEFYLKREREYMLFFEAKKKYYLKLNKISTGPLKESDSLDIERMALRDPGFLSYLNKNGGKELHTLQKKCRNIISAALVTTKLQKLNEQRKAYFLSFFKAEAVEKQVHFKALRDTIPFNGFSQYGIQFKKNYPENLLEAYEKMKELNDNSPRNKFKAEREKDKRLLDAK